MRGNSSSGELDLVSPPAFSTFSESRNKGALYLRNSGSFSLRKGKAEKAKGCIIFFVVVFLGPTIGLKIHKALRVRDLTR
jgi:hypothetical protein